MSTKELKEKRFALITQMREVSDLIQTEGRALTDEENSKVAAIEADISKYDDQIKLRERTDALGHESGNVDAHRTLEHNQGDERTDAQRRANAFRAWGAVAGGVDPSEQDRADMSEFNLRTNKNEMQMLTSAELRVLSSQTGGAGGYTVADDTSFMGQVERALLSYGGMREVSQVVRTGNGAPLPWPSANDTGNTGAWIAESATRSAATDPSWDIHTFNAHTVTSNIIRVPYELLQDTAFDLEGYLAEISAERIARTENTAFTTGDGAGEPLGITLSTTAGLTAAATDAITSDELLELKYSVDRAYRNNDFFMMEDATLLALRKLKDGDGQYIWAPGMLAGEPDVLYGSPVVINEDMASLATGNITVLYGQKGKYKIREVSTVLVQRLVELYAASGQVGFITTMRADGALIDAGTNPVKHIIQL